MKHLTSILILGALCLFGASCRTTPRNTTAVVPSDQKTPIVINTQTAEVLKAHIGQDKVMASVLESVQDSGNAIVVDHEGYVMGVDGTPWLNELGQPLKLRTVVIAKLNSLHNLANIAAGRVEYTVGGYQRDQLPAHLKHMDLAPTALQLVVDGLDAGAVPATPLIRAADAKQREAIFSGMSALATARGAAFAVTSRALADGMVALTTVAGREIIGRLNGTTLIETGIAGALKAKEATITPEDGEPEKVLIPVPN